MQMREPTKTDDEMVADVLNTRMAAAIEDREMCAVAYVDAVAQGNPDAIRAARSDFYAALNISEWCIGEWEGWTGHDADFIAPAMPMEKRGRS